MLTPEVALGPTGANCKKNVQLHSDSWNSPNLDREVSAADKPHLTSGHCLEPRELYGLSPVFMPSSTTKAGGRHECRGGEYIRLKKEKHSVFSPVL